MRTRSTFLGLTLAAVLAVAGAARAQKPSAFGPGEQSTYQVSYLGVVAGTAQITVGAETTHDGKEVLPIVTLARSQSVVEVYPVRDKFVSYWDAKTERCVGSVLYADENGKRRRQVIKFDPAKDSAKVIKQAEGGDEKISTHEVEPGVVDIASAAFALRNTPLEVGKVYQLPVFTGQRTFSLRATVESKQKLRTAMGTKDVFKLRVQTGFSGKFESKRDLFAYLTADDAHVPVRIDADFVLGTITAELTDYKSGRSYPMRAQPPLTECSSGG